MLETVYAHEHWNKDSPSIFLAGPSPREQEGYNWRPKAIQILQELDFNGGVFIPLPRDGNWLSNYDAQVVWELKCLDRATTVVFWIPRDLICLPGFTTNVEYGLFLKSGKSILGYPPEAEKMRYLHSVAKIFGVPIFHTIRETLACALQLASK